MQNFEDENDLINQYVNLNMLLFLHEYFSRKCNSKTTVTPVDNILHDAFVPYNSRVSVSKNISCSRKKVNCVIPDCIQYCPEANQRCLEHLCRYCF